MRSAAQLCLLVACWCGIAADIRLSAAEPSASPSSVASPFDTNSASATATNNGLHFNVRVYETSGEPLLPAGTQAAIFSKHTGTNVSLAEIVKAASELLLEYHKEGYPTVSVAVAQERITNGVVGLNVFHG